jgi:hypothetical protein
MPRQHRASRAVHKERRHAVHNRRAQTSPVTVAVAPAEAVLAAARIPVAASDQNRDTYLLLAGVAFALLALTGLSLHFLAARFTESGFSR